MATITERTQKNGAVSYRVQWRDPEDGLSSRTLSDPDKAKDLKAFLDANGNSFKLANEAKGRVRSKAPTVYDAIEWHINALGGNVEPGTARDYRSFLSTKFENIKSIPLDQLTSTHVRNWFDGMDCSAKYKKISIRSCLRRCGPS